MKNTSTIVLLVILLVGLSLLLYPTVSNYWNSFRQTRAIGSYMELVSNIDIEEYNRILNSARDYNQKNKDRKLWSLTDEERELYNKELNLDGNGIMGYINIPAVNCTLPIYHGTSDSVLQIAIGHLENSSLPVGGESTHCVVSGHRGLPSALLFTNLDQLIVGDVFELHVLDELLTYEVDQIRIVDPEDITELTIEEGSDLCTMITCTPYGVNSHRLLVRGHRVENRIVSDVRVSADALQIDDTIVTIGIFVIIFTFSLGWLFISYRRR